jgi:hypothetical protein
MSTTPASALSTLNTMLSPLELSSSVGSNTYGLGTATYSVLTNGLGWGREILVRGGIEGFLTFQGLGPQGALSGVGGGPLAGLGQASSIGGLSVPPSWAAAAPEIQPLAVSLSAASTSTAPAAAVGLPPGTAFQEALMGTMSGQGTLTRPTDRRAKNKEDQDEKDKNGKESEWPAAALASSSGWLASSWAYSNRRRPDPQLISV